MFFKQTSAKRALIIGSAAFIISAFSGIFLPNEVKAATVTPRIEVSADAGNTVVEVIKVSNEERQSRTYYTTIENFESADESGNPRFTTRLEDLATWISVPESLTVGPGQSADLPITINIPANAESGGHFAAVFLQTTPPGDESSNVAISSKLGTLILLRVGGDFQQGATLLEFGTTDRQRFFAALPIEFYYRFQNVGDDHLKPVGDILITNTVGRLTKILPANPVDGSVLPKSIRRFQTTWASNHGALQQEVGTAQTQPSGFWNAVKYQWNNFALGKYTATLKVVYGTKELQSAKEKFTFWVFPWQLLIVIIIVLIAAFYIGRAMLRRYNRHILSKAGQYRSNSKR